MRKIRFGLGGLFLLWVIGVAIWAAVALAQIARGETVGSVAAPGIVNELPPPNPLRCPLVASLALSSASPASLALFDVAGRRVVAGEIGSLGPGPHRVLVAKDLAAGAYWLVLRQQGVEKKTCVVALR